MDVLFFVIVICSSSVMSAIWKDKAFQNELESLAGKRKLNEDLNVFEGDMVLRETTIHRATTKGKVLLDEDRKKVEKDGVKTSAMTKPYWYRWRHAVVPYQIHKSLKCRWLCSIYNPEKIIRKAMMEWSRKTCIRFRPRHRSDRHWVLFKSAPFGRCAAEVGRIGGQQHVWLGRGCLRHGIVLHEIGHVLGFYHEQSRPDRDEHINIHWRNIFKKHHRQFRKYESYSDMGTPYDYDSVMHYGKNEFKIPWAFLGHSITTKKPWSKKLGQRKYVSAIDAQEMNLYYSCPKKN